MYPTETHDGLHNSEHDVHLRSEIQVSTWMIVNLYDVDGRQLPVGSPPPMV